MVTVGWVIIVVGIVATIAGVAGGIAQLLRDIANRKGASISDLPVEFLQALQALIEALTRAPVWLVLLIFGFALTVYGGTLIR